MNCTQYYCIYSRRKKCILDNPRINSEGVCEDCIIVSSDKNFNEAKKEKELQKMKDYWAKQDKVNLDNM
ncbi:MAG: hypothetical protein FWE24_03610 [Defluviitaleaceae bacterium]|nr:hypothetical protein [Defluviitaleaceae bacterium]